MTMTNENTRPSESDSGRDDPEDDINYDDLELIDMEEVMLINEEQGEAQGREDSQEEANSEDDQENPDHENFQTVDAPDSVLTFSAHSSAIFCCNLSSDGKYAITGGEDDKCFIWSTELPVEGNVQIICKPPAFSDSVISVEFSHDNKYAAMASMDGDVKCYKLTGNMPSLIWEENVGYISWMKWHEKAHVLLAGGMDTYLWKIPSGDCKLFPGSESASECGMFMPDGKRCVTCNNNSDVKVFDLASTKSIHKKNLEEGPIISVAARDNNLIAVGTSSGKVFLITTQNTFKVVAVLSCCEDDESYPVETIAFCHDQRHSYVVAGTTQHLCVFDYSRKVLREKVLEEDGITRLTWPQGSPFIYVGTKIGTVSVYDGLTFKLRKKLKGHTDTILDLSVSRDGAKLITASEDSRSMIFDLTKISLECQN